MSQYVDVSSEVKYTFTGKTVLSGTKTYNCKVGDLFFLWIDNTGLSGFTGAERVVTSDSSDAQGVVLKAISNKVTINTNWQGWIVWVQT